MQFSKPYYVVVKLFIIRKKAENLINERLGYLLS